MTTPTRLLTGFPVEVALHSELRHVQSREPGIYSFTCAPEAEDDGLWCDSAGLRPGSIAWGLTLDPVALEGAPTDLQASCLYVETTGPELRRLIAALEELHQVNFAHTCNGMPDATCNGCLMDAEAAR